MNPSLALDLRYAWEPFLCSGRQLPFDELQATRLERRQCSHWGAVVYKWQGTLSQGDKIGKTGLYVGQAKDLRARIKQYIRGTQKRGNVYMRENFLLLGDVRLHVLKIDSAEVRLSEQSAVSIDDDSLVYDSMRLLVEQAVIFRESALAEPDTWIVNRTVSLDVGV